MRNIVDKSEKSSGIGFSMECFTADLSHFCSTNHQKIKVGVASQAAK